MTGDGTAVGAVPVDPFPINPQRPRQPRRPSGGIAVTARFTKGQFLTLSIGFDNGETATLEVPVVDDDGQWAGLDTATPSPSASPSGHGVAVRTPSSSHLLPERLRELT